MSDYLTDADLKERFSATSQVQGRCHQRLCHTPAIIAYTDSRNPYGLRELVSRLRYELDWGGDWNTAALYCGISRGRLWGLLNLYLPAYATASVVTRQYGTVQRGDCLIDYVADTTRSWSVRPTAPARHPVGQLLDIVDSGLPSVGIARFADPQALMLFHPIPGIDTPTTLIVGPQDPPAPRGRRHVVDIDLLLPLTCRSHWAVPPRDWGYLQ